MGIITTALEVVGLAALSVAGFLVAPALGCAAVGLSLLLLGWGLGREA